MDEVIVQLKRIADAFEAQGRFEQGWLKIHQEIEARHQQERAEDLARIREQQAEEDRRSLAREDRQMQELEAAKKALQERIAALDADEIKDIAQHVLTGIFVQEKSEETNG